MINRRRVILALVLFGYLILQLAFIAGKHAAPFSDGLDYDRRALMLLQHHTFYSPDWRGSTYHGPAYLIFLAGIYRVFGHSWGAVYAVQSLLTTGTILGIYLVAKRLFSTRLAVVSMLLSLGFLPFFAYSHLITPESLFLFLTVFSCYAFLRGLQSSSTLWLCVAGILCGMASLTRSQALLLPLVFVLAVLLDNKPVATLKRLKVGIVLMIGLMVLVLSPWVIRNYVEEGHFIPGDTVGGLNLLIGNNGVTSGFGYNELALWDNHAVAQAISSGKTGGEVDSVMRREAADWIRAHPASFVLRTFGRAGLFFGTARDWLVRDMGSLTLDKLWSTQQVYTSLILFFAAFGGVAGLFRGRKTLLPLLLFLYTLAVVSVFYFQTRYRLPAMPFAIITASYGLSVAYGLVKRRWSAHLERIAPDESPV